MDHAVRPGTGNAHATRASIGIAYNLGATLEQTRADIVAGTYMIPSNTSKWPPAVIVIGEAIASPLDTQSHASFTCDWPTFTCCW